MVVLGVVDKDGLKATCLIGYTVTPNRLKDCAISSGCWLEMIRWKV